MKRYAIITGDIVGYSATSESRETTTGRLRELLDLATSEYGSRAVPKAVLFRGDSFQWATDQPKWGLRVALLLRCGLLAITPSDTSQVYDVRVSIGIGAVDQWGDSLSTSDGEAFRNSGPFLDQMEDSARIRIQQQNPDTQGLLDVVCKMSDALSAKWSPLQAQALLQRLQGMAQKEIARDLFVSEAAISQRLNAMHWPVVAKWLDWFETYFSS